MRVAVFQIGARHNYAIPRMLQRAGMLEALWTGPCANRGFGLWLSRLIPKRVRAGKIAALTKRNIEGVPWEKIHAVDRLLFHRIPHNCDYSEKMQRYSRQNAAFARAVVNAGLPAADLAYFMAGECTPLIERVKRQGTRVVVDFTVTPMTFRIIAEERRKFPGWEPSQEIDVEAIERQFRQQLRMADLCFCPSENVVEGLRSFPEFAEQKCRVVPYGIPRSAGRGKNKPVAGRILFAGTAELRKGIHYYAEAANLLRATARNYDFRVAGGAARPIQERAECRNLHFLGRLSRSAMTEELLSADLLVLPTLAEGSATVVNEAIAVGLPVVTTRAAGSLITDGHGGFLVPERNAANLAMLIARVVSDRQNRERLALGALELAGQITELAWQNRLLLALQAFWEGRLLMPATS